MGSGIDTVALAVMLGNDELDGHLADSEDDIKWRCVTHARLRHKSRRTQHKTNVSKRIIKHKERSRASRHE